MRPVGQPRDDPTDATAPLRHRCVPMRTLGHLLIVARPSDGAPVVLADTAALVWRMLDDWITPAEINRRLAETFPEVSEQERATTLAATLTVLRDEGLVEL
jgi:hypothetical protein